jgi:hypothetical protein
VVLVLAVFDQSDRNKREEAERERYNRRVEKSREEKDAVVVCFLGTPFEFGVCKSFIKLQLGYHG